MNFGLNLLIIVLLLLAAGCAGPQTLSLKPTPIPTLIPATLPPQPTATPPSTPATEAPPPTPATTDQGADLFNDNCSFCHDLGAETKVGPGLAGVFDRDKLPNGQPVNDDALKEWIRTGGGAMPGIPLQDDELEALIAFLKEATK